MSGIPEPLSDAEIAERLAGLPGWARHGDEITRAFRHTYHECVHFAVYVAARAEEVSHHPDMHLTWQRIEFRITTHDAGHKITEADFMLARHIDAIARARGATPVELKPPRGAGCPASLGKRAGHRHASDKKPRLIVAVRSVTLLAPASSQQAISFT